MKKNILKVMMVAAVAVVSSYNVYSSMVKVDQFLDTSLGDVEALAACEVSSDPKKNIGICVSDIYEIHEYCAKNTSTWPGGPACSGTIGI